MDLPDNWPRTGLLDGKTVDLATMEETLPKERWAEVQVDVPGEGLIRPWRFMTPAGEVDRDPKTGMLRI